jgi:DtxR family Mn-dependent transcriptional regulator
MSESVERRLLELLDNPTASPYGNPIPGLAELIPDAAPGVDDADAVASLSEVCRDDVTRVIVRRLAEPIQEQADTMALMRRIGVMPGASVKAHRSPGGVMIGSAGEYTELTLDVADHVFVQTAG